MSQEQGLGCECEIANEAAQAARRTHGDHIGKGSVRSRRGTAARVFGCVTMHDRLSLDVTRLNACLCARHSPLGPGSYRVVLYRRNPCI